MPEAHRSSQDGGSREMHLSGLEHDGLIERHVPGLFIFTEENPQQDSVTRDLHGYTHFKALKWLAATWPSQTARRHVMTEATMLAPA